MPHAEYRARHGGNRIKIFHRQTGGQAGILHPDFDGQRFLRVVRQFDELGGEKAQQVADAVVQYHHAENQPARLGDFGTVQSHHRADNQGNRHDGHQRQYAFHRLGLPVQEKVAQHAQHNRQHDDFQNIHQHGGSGNVQPLMRQQVENGGGQHRREQCGNRRYRHRQCDVAPREEGHHIRSRPARTCADQNHAGRNRGRQLQRNGQNVSRQRHDDELRHHARQYGFRMLPQNFEVRRAERQPHAEHNHAQKPGDIRLEPNKGFGQGIGRHGGQCRPQGEGFAEKIADGFKCVHIC